MKILMLHGYTQNGDTFRLKLRRFTDRIIQAYPGAAFSWPSGPVRLSTTDIPGRTLGRDGGRHSHELDLRAWFDLRFSQDPPEGLMQSLDIIAAVLKTEGPFDGIMAFSQGTIIAAVVASLLQGQVRQQAHEQAQTGENGIMPYPEAFAGLQHPPLKFGVLCASRVGKEQYYDWLYESPTIATPFCHVVGRLDSVVDHAEREATLERLAPGKKSVVIEHSGGHYVPTDRSSLNSILRFMAKYAAQEPGRGRHLESLYVKDRQVDLSDSISLGYRSQGTCVDLDNDRDAGMKADRPEILELVDVR